MDDASYVFIGWEEVCGGNESPKRRDAEDLVREDSVATRCSWGVLAKMRKQESRELSLLNDWEVAR